MAENKERLRIYSSISKEFAYFKNPDDFFKYKLDNNLKISYGLITNLKILKRKTLSNKGNALDGLIFNSTGLSVGLNIGGNPIGTGGNQYIPFLEEMKCRKIFGLYYLKSIEKKAVGYLSKEDTRWGIFVPESMSKFLDFYSIK